jgi:hypothetical protein
VAFVQTAPWLIEIDYRVESDMLPEAQVELMRAIEVSTVTAHVGLLFRVYTLDVPVSVVPFWLEATKRLAPQLAAMAIVSDSLTVRSAARGFAVSNAFRSVEIAVKAFRLSEQVAALEWLKRTLHV